MKKRIYLLGGIFFITVISIISIHYAKAEQLGSINPKMYDLPETDLGFDVNC